MRTTPCARTRRPGRVGHRPPDGEGESLAAWSFDDLIDYAGTHSVPVNLLLTDGYPGRSAAPPAHAGSNLAKTLDPAAGPDSPRPNAGYTCEPPGNPSRPKPSTSFAKPWPSSNDLYRCSAAGKGLHVLLHLAGKAGLLLRCSAAARRHRAQLPWSCSPSATNWSAGLACACWSRGSRTTSTISRLLERPDGDAQSAADPAAAGRDRRTPLRRRVRRGRRDEEKARAKERVISLRDEFGQWNCATSVRNCGTCTTLVTDPASTSASSR